MEATPRFKIEIAEEGPFKVSIHDAYKKETTDIYTSIRAYRTLLAELVKLSNEGWKSLQASQGNPRPDPAQPSGYFTDANLYVGGAREGDIDPQVWECPLHGRVTEVLGFGDRVLCSACIGELLGKAIQQNTGVMVSVDGDQTKAGLVKYVGRGTKFLKEEEENAE